MADVHHDAVAYHLPRNAGAASAGYEVSVEPFGFVDKLHYLLFVFRIGHAPRQFTIGGSVGGVGNAVQAVGENLHG